MLIILLQQSCIPSLVKPSPVTSSLHQPLSLEHYFRKEFGNLAQGDIKTKTKCTDFIHILTRGQIKTIPRDWVIMHAFIVMDFCLQKEDSNRVCLTACGNSSCIPKWINQLHSWHQHGKSFMEEHAENSKQMLLLCCYQEFLSLYLKSLLKFFWTYCWTVPFTEAWNA